MYSSINNPVQGHHTITESLKVQDRGRKAPFWPVYPCLLIQEGVVLKYGWYNHWTIGTTWLRGFKARVFLLSTLHCKICWSVDVFLPTFMQMTPLHPADGFDLSIARCL